MFYIFVYLARNTLKLTQTDYNSLGTKKSRTEEETKNSCCAPITSFPGDATACKGRLPQDFTARTFGYPPRRNGQFITLSSVLAVEKAIKFGCRLQY